MTGKAPAVCEAVFHSIFYSIIIAWGCSSRPLSFDDGTGGNMKTKDIIKLKNNDDIFHTRYGRSKVKEVMFSMNDLFGVVITPISNEGKTLLQLDSETNIPDFLKGSIRQLRTI